MRIVAIGRTEILYNSILELNKRGHKVVLIITGKSEQYQYIKNSEDFKKLAKELDAEFLITENINSDKVLGLIYIHKPDIAISYNWKTIIGQKIINSFSFGILNAHAGDLPRYKGNSVRNWAIIAGEEEIVLTIHYMTIDLDAGAILLKKKIPLKKDIRIKKLYDFVLKYTPLMFAETIDGLEKGTITSLVQPIDPKKSLRCYPRLPKDSEIDWNKPVIHIDRLIRASSEPFSGAYTYIGNEKMIIWRAHIEYPKYQYLSIPGQVVERRQKTGEVAIATSDGFLVLEEIETEHKGQIKPIEIINTIRTRLGLHVNEEIQNMISEINELKKEIKMLKKVKL